MECGRATAALTTTGTSPAPRNTPLAHATARRAFPRAAAPATAPLRRPRPASADHCPPAAFAGRARPPDRQNGRTIAGEGYSARGPAVPPSPSTRQGRSRHAPAAASSGGKSLTAIRRPAEDERPVVRGRWTWLDFRPRKRRREAADDRFGKLGDAVERHGRARDAAASCGFCPFFSFCLCDTVSTVFVALVSPRKPLEAAAAGRRGWPTCGPPRRSATDRPARGTRESDLPDSWPGPGR